jgi:prepilin-type N-terminal cleavage/methylation domain-containing protein
MKNKGYTLAEVLITIGIIGILAAVLLPLINKYKPDANMAMFIKTYDTIVTATNEIVSNEQLYPIKNAGDNIDYRLIPLANTSSITIYGNTVSGNSKYCNLLALSIHTVGNVACSDEYITNPTNFTPSFKMANGVEVEVLTNSIVSSSGGSYQSDIYIDVNGSDKGKNCFYSDSCTYPDRFKLIVSANGNIQVNDAKGKAYLARRADWKLRKDNIIVSDEEEQQPATPCQWNSFISADDPACKPCEYDSSLWAGSSACQKPVTPCQWNSSLSEDDVDCQPCKYDSSIWVGSSDCKEPTEPCKWNKNISADDSACKPCEYDSSIWAGSSACKKPTKTCKWNKNISADDPKCIACIYDPDEWAYSDYCEELGIYALRLASGETVANPSPTISDLTKTKVRGIYVDSNGNYYRFIKYAYNSYNAQVEVNTWVLTTENFTKSVNSLDDYTIARNYYDKNGEYYFDLYDGDDASSIKDYKLSNFDNPLYIKSW